MKIIDLSRNSIVDIADDYFIPVKDSLTHLYLARNLLSNVSQNVFGWLYELQWLDLSENRIQYIDSDTFRDVNKVQVSGKNYNIPCSRVRVCSM